MSTIRANAITDAAGGNTTTINGITPALATQAEAQAGTDNTKLMTPLRVKEATTASLAIATQAEAQAGTDNTKLMTPLRVTEAVLSDFNVTGTAPLYACRAWVNFNGTGTVAIRASGNVSSITDNGAGNYTINFTTAMSDVNYAVTGSCAFNETAAFGNLVSLSTVSRATSSVQIVCGVQSDTVNNGVLADCLQVSVAVFR